jgi:hypothetical protein
MRRKPTSAFEVRADAGRVTVTGRVVEVTPNVTGAAQPPPSPRYWQLGCSHARTYKSAAKALDHNVHAPTVRDPSNTVADTTTSSPRTSWRPKRLPAHSIMRQRICRRTSHPGTISVPHTATHAPEDVQHQLFRSMPREAEKTFKRPLPKELRPILRYSRHRWTEINEKHGNELLRC